MTVATILPTRDDTALRLVASLMERAVVQDFAAAMAAEAAQEAERTGRPIWRMSCREWRGGVAPAR